MGTATRWLRNLWRTLGSVRLAAFLLLALLLFSILASLFPQMPDDPATHSSWLSAARLRYGPAAGLWRALGLFSIGRSPLFLALLAVLLLNTLVCTAQRLSALWRSFAHTPVVVQSDAFFQGAALRAAWAAMRAADGVRVVRERLVSRRYRVRIAYDGRYTHLYAERDRWSLFASPASHVAAIALFLALVLRPALNWRSCDPTFGPAVVAMSVFWAAVAASMWMPYRRLWLRLDGQGAEMAGVGDFAGTFEVLVEALSEPPLEGETVVVG